MRLDPATRVGFFSFNFSDIQINIIETNITWTVDGSQLNTSIDIIQNTVDNKAITISEIQFKV